MRDLGLLIIRLVVGGLLMGHGSQKLFGWFKGPGIKGMGGWLESMGLRPGQRWAFLAGLGEFGGGLLAATGFLHPLGPVAIIGPMGVATGTVHAGKPIWAGEGGAELPVINMAVSAGLILTGPGRYSLDRVFGTRMPGAFALLAGAGVGAGIGFVVAKHREHQEQMRAQAAGEGQEETKTRDQRRCLVDS